MHVRATRECLKGESIAKVGYKMFFRPQKHIYNMDTSPALLEHARSG